MALSTLMGFLTSFSELLIVGVFLCSGCFSLLISACLYNAMDDVAGAEGTMESDDDDEDEEDKADDDGPLGLTGFGWE